MLYFLVNQRYQSRLSPNSRSFCDFHLSVGNAAPPLSRREPYSCRFCISPPFSALQFATANLHLSFQSLTTVKFCNPFFFMILHLCRGVCTPSLARSGDFKGGGVAGASGHEVLNFGDGVNGAASADGGAIERGGGAGQIELLLQRPALQQCVNESGVKNIARAGSVHCLGLKSRLAVELLAVPSEYAILTQSGDGDAVAVAAVNLRQGFLQVVLGG